MIKKSELAPIGITVYNRIEHTKIIFESLLKNELVEESEIYIFSDCEKNSHDKNSVLEVRKYIDSLSGFKSKNIILRDQNYGMADNTIDGINHIFKRHDKLIWLEDDAQLSKYFLKFMNQGLNYYETQKKIMSISGYCFPTDNINTTDSAVITRLMLCWTWATWKDRWLYFDRNISIMNKFNRSMKYQFNFENTNLFWRQLVGNKTARAKTWAIFWYASIFLNNGLCVCPLEPLAIDTGSDGSGTNIEKTDIFKNDLSKKDSFIFPSVIQENKDYYESLKKYFKSIKPSLFHRLKFRLKNDFYRLIGKKL